MRKRQLTELQRPDLAAFQQQEKTPIALILDNVRSALNVGSVFRTADAFALERLYLCGITAQPPHREILKTALGATESIPWTYTATTPEAVELARAAGYSVWAVEQAEGSRWLHEFAPPAGRKLALVFGNEVHGVSEAVLPLIDGAVEVPQYGTKHSLNIAVCVGIVVWEVFRRWTFEHG